VKGTGCLGVWGLGLGRGGGERFNVAMRFSACGCIYISVPCGSKYRYIDCCRYRENCCSCVYICVNRCELVLWYIDKKYCDSRRCCWCGVGVQVVGLAGAGMRCCCWGVVVGDVMYIHLSAMNIGILSSP